MGIDNETFPMAVETSTSLGSMVTVPGTRETSSNPKTTLAERPLPKNQLSIQLTFQSEIF
jgi:hypothetical protein